MVKTRASMATRSQMVIDLRALLMLTIVACTGDVRSADRAHRAVHASVRTRGTAEGEPESQLTRFLSLSVATREKNLVYVDSVYTDGDIRVGGDVAPCLAGDETVNRWLAASHVLSVTVQGDRADATAAITTAAREVEEPDGESFVVNPQIQEDTARWRLLKSGTSGKWMVCGPGSHPKEIFGLFKVGRTIKWPNGGSQESVMSTIDSIRRARGLPVLR
jgi:hypothetical protein